MNGYLLDTNIPSETLKPSPEKVVLSWLQEQSVESQFLSAITMGEIRRGASMLPMSKRRNALEDFLNVVLPSWFGSRILPVSPAVADRWGRLDAQRHHAGRPLDVTDGLIAATALEYDLTLVTRNVKDFAGLGLRLINPWA